MCANCRKHHAMSDTVIQARAAQKYQMKNMYAKTFDNNERAMCTMQVINM